MLFTRVMALCQFLPILSTEALEFGGMIAGTLRSRDLRSVTLGGMVLLSSILNGEIERFMQQMNMET